MPYCKRCGEWMEEDEITGLCDECFEADFEDEDEEWDD